MWRRVLWRLVFWGGVVEAMCAAAIEVRGRAYAPYSNFRVGACLLTADGQLVTGCNCENGVLGLSICAERVAMTRAVAMGRREYVAIAIAAEPLATPCGSCRQFMVELAADLQVICVDASNPELVRRWALSDLLPDRFALELPAEDGSLGEQKR